MTVIQKPDLIQFSYVIGHIDGLDRDCNKNFKHCTIGVDKNLNHFIVERDGDTFYSREG